MNPNFLELLAPARNLETGMAAIDHGADAVYIGADQFGARKQAGNSVADIARLVRYAHFYRAKVFVALNTILYDEELEAAQKLIHQLYDSGVDALIVQDMGILEMDLPPLPLHASTQTHNFELDRIEFLAKLGLQRIVLARELSLIEIEAVREKTDIELEYFIHGALCVSLSGQCYMSHAIGGRSANRGECAQACRLSYSVENPSGKKLLHDKHVLSLKDLNHSTRLEKLARAGIQSFKIEGRLKGLDYVKNTVAYYRKEIDDLLNRGIGTKASSGTVTTKFEPDLEKSFHRSCTTYFLNGREKQMANFGSPKSTGKEIGTVKRVDKKGIEINTKETVSNGDGLCFVDPQGNLKGLRVNKVNGNFLEAQLPKGLQKGMVVFRNHDQVFTQFLEKSKDCRLIAVDLKFSETEEGFLLEITDEDGNRVAKGLKTDKELAQKPESAYENLSRQLAKTGGTAFVAGNIELSLSQAYFIPMGKLNQLRREALEEIELLRNKNYIREKIEFKRTEHNYPTSQLDYSANIANRLAKQFYERHGVVKTERAFELLKNRSGADLMTTRYCLKFEMGICPVHQKPNGKAEKGSLFIENKMGRFRLDFDCKNCLMHVRKA